MSIYIEKERLDAMMDAYTNKGLKRADDLSREADKTERKITMSRGNNSVFVFMQISRKISIVDKLVPATKTEDMDFGTDLWVCLNRDQPVRMLPVQIKSSKPGVDEFKNSNVFKRQNGKIIVVNSHVKRKHDDVIEDFLKEYNRVIQKVVSNRQGNFSRLDNS